MSDIQVFAGAYDTLVGVATAVLPLVVFFLVFQLLLLRLPRRYVASILKGTLLASVGLLLFLQGVHVGLLPFGRAIGEALGALPHKWLLLPLGFLLGFLTTWGEPSVRILSDQVEKASSGSIHQTMVLYAVCLGVGLIVGLGMLRIGYGIPLLYIMIPGYALVIAIMWFSDLEFLAIAIDAGGVATGPLANTFLLALALGLSSTMGRQDPILHGLGLVALIALAPIVSVMLLGFVFRAKEYRKE
jgi:Protein of unknown function (DUF1538)